MKTWQIWLLLVYGWSCQNSQAQTLKKYDLYNNPNVVWAAEVDLDLVERPDTTFTWDDFAESGYSKRDFKANGFLWTVKGGAFLGQDHLVKAINSKQLKQYYSDALEGPPLDFLIDLDEDPDPIAVLRLRCWVYYDTTAPILQIHPLAVGLMRVQRQAPGVTQYREVGWIPVLDTPLPNSTWDGEVHHDVPWNRFRIFKQEWTTEAMANDFLKRHLQQADQPFFWDGLFMEEQELLSPEMVRERLGVEEPVFDPFADGPETFAWYPLTYQKLLGINFSIYWKWSPAPAQLQVYYYKFTPIFHGLDAPPDPCDDTKDLQLEYRYGYDFEKARE